VVDKWHVTYGPEKGRIRLSALVREIRQQTRCCRRAGFAAEVGISEENNSPHTLRAEKEA